MNDRNSWLAAAVLALAAAPAMAQQHINKRASVAPDATVEVSNVQGSVEVAAWDRNEVELAAVLESSKDELEFDATERHVRIKVERPHGKYGRDSDEDDAILKLQVPKGAHVVVDTVSADITVSGIRGEQDLQSVSGDVDTQAFDTPVSATSVSGDITVAVSGGKADISTENVSGNSTVTGARGNYHGQVVSGDIKAMVASAERVQLNSVSGDVELSVDLTPTSRIDIESVSGELTLKLKPPVNADFDLESFSGDIGNCFGQKARHTSKYTPGSRLNFTQGSGGARVEMQTLSGGIDICDH